MGKKVEKKANNVFFLTGEWTAFRRFVRQEVAFPEGMPSVYLTWLSYRKRGYNVYVIMIGHFNKKETMQLNGFDLHLIPNSFLSRVLGKLLGENLGGLMGLCLNNIKLFLYAVKLASCFRPTIVYSLRENYAYAAWLLSKRFRCVCVKRIFGTFLYQRAQNYKNTIEKMCCLLQKGNWLCPAHMTIITNDGTQGDKMAEILNFEKDRYRFWFNGIDKTWTSDEQVKKLTRKEMGFLDDHFVLLYLSRLAPWKRQDRVIRALKLIIKEVPNARLVLAGDGPWRAHLTALVDDLELTSCVKFLGMVPHNNVKNVMTIADVFLQTNDYSNLGNTLLEAMVCGRTIVTWDVGGTKQVIKENKTGRLLPDPEPSTIAEAVVDLAKNPEKAKRLGRNARIFAEQKLQSWDERLDMEINLVEELCSRQQQDSLSITPVHGLQKKR